VANDKKRILIIDDEESIRDGCHQTLSRAGFIIDTTGDAQHGMEMSLKDIYDVILLDIRMPKMDGIEILKRLKGHIKSKIIIITGYGTISLSVEAMKLGASDFLTKPFTTQEIKNIVQSAISSPDTESVAEEQIKTLIGNSEYLKELKGTVKRVARTNSTVLLTGESGTGKELIASTIHQLSSRSSRPYLPVDCSSLVESLMETELFGHVKGAFSGATGTRDGRFQMADKGTLFLDEISNLSLSVQAKLLRVIQEHEVPRVGSSVPEKVDVRLITATNKDLRSMVDKTEFREDLFYRISVVPIHIKPLREHKSDILPIAEYYLDFFSKKHSGKRFYLSEDAKKSIVSYSWPGNIRELKNTVERLCVLCNNEEISLSDILYYGQKTEPKTPVFDSVTGRMTLVEVEKEHIEKALDHFNYQISKTACFLGIDRKTLRLKIRTYGIKTRE
jgi:DNA-binding NtrC family response regulator